MNGDLVKQSSNPSSSSSSSSSSSQFNFNLVDVPKERIKDIELSRYSSSTTSSPSFIPTMTDNSMTSTTPSPCFLSLNNIEIPSGVPLSTFSTMTTSNNLLTSSVPQSMAPTPTSIQVPMRDTINYEAEAVTSEIIDMNELTIAILTNLFKHLCFLQQVSRSYIVNQQTFDLSKNDPFNIFSSTVTSPTLCSSSSSSSSPPTTTLSPPYNIAKEIPNISLSSSCPALRTEESLLMNDCFNHESLLDLKETSFSNRHDVANVNQEGFLDNIIIKNDNLSPLHFYDHQWDTIWSSTSPSIISTGNRDLENMQINSPLSSEISHDYHDIISSNVDIEDNGDEIKDDFLEKRYVNDEDIFLIHLEEEEEDAGEIPLWYFDDDEESNKENMEIIDFDYIENGKSHISLETFLSSYTNMQKSIQNHRSLNGTSSTIQPPYISSTVHESLRDYEIQGIDLEGSVVNLCWLDDDDEDTHFEYKILQHIIGQHVQIYSSERNGWRCGMIVLRACDGSHVIDFVDGNIEHIMLDSTFWRLVS